MNRTHPETDLGIEISDRSGRSQCSRHLGRLRRCAEARNVSQPASRISRSAAPGAGVPDACRNFEPKEGFWTSSKFDKEERVF